MKLELEHLAPYLKCGLKIRVWDIYKCSISRLNEVKGTADVVLNCSWLSILEKDIELFDDNSQYPFKITNSYFKQNRMLKPILKPLSDYMDINSKAMVEVGGDITTQIELTELANRNISLAGVSYRTIQFMSYNHIDFNRLIDNNLAIDINTLKETV